MLNGVRVDSIFYFLYTNEMLVMDDNEIVASKVWWSSTFKMNSMLKANCVQSYDPNQSINQGDFLVCFTNHTQ